MQNKDNVSLLLGHNQNKRMEPEGTLTTRRQYALRLCLSKDALTSLYIACTRVSGGIDCQEFSFTTKTNQCIKRTAASHGESKKRETKVFRIQVLGSYT